MCGFRLRPMMNSACVILRTQEQVSAHHPHALTDRI